MAPAGSASEDQAELREVAVCFQDMEGFNDSQDIFSRLQAAEVENIGFQFLLFAKPGAWRRFSGDAWINHPNFFFGDFQRLGNVVFGKLGVGDDERRFLGLGFDSLRPVPEAVAEREKMGKVEKR